MSSGPALLVQAPQRATGGGTGRDSRGEPARRAVTRRGLLRLISPVALLLLWQVESAFRIVSQQKLPPPSEVWSTAVSLITTNSPAYGTLQDAMLVSLERVAIGFGVGATFGILLALVTGLSQFGEYAADPPMHMLRT